MATIIPKEQVDLSQFEPEVDSKIIPAEQVDLSQFQPEIDESSPLAKVWNWANTPIGILKKPLAAAKELGAASIHQRNKLIPFGGRLKDVGEAAEIRAFETLADTFSTPLGIGLAPFAIPRVVRAIPAIARTVGAGLAGTGLYNTPQVLRELNDASTPEELGSALADVGLTGAQILGGGALALHPKPRIPSTLKPPPLPRGPLRLPEVTESTIAERANQARSMENLVEGVEQHLNRPPLIPIQQFIEQNLRMGEHGKNFPRPPAKENYLNDLERYRVWEEQQLGEARRMNELSRLKFTRPSGEFETLINRRPIDIESQVIPVEKPSTQLPEGYEQLPAKIQETPIPSQVAPERASPYGISKQVAAELESRGFTPEDISKMTPEVANEMYNAGTAPEKGLPENKPLRTATQQTKTGETSLYSGLDPTLIPKGLEKLSEIFPEVAKKAGDIVDYGLPGVRSQLDVLRSKKLPEYDKMADAFNETSNLTRQYGKYQNQMLEKTQPLSKSQRDRLLQHLLDEDRLDKVMTPDPDIKDAYTDLRKIYTQMRQDQINAQQPVWVNGFPRPAKINPSAWARVVSREVLDTLLNESNTTKADQLRKDFIKGQMDQGATLEQAERNLQDFEKAFVHDTQNADYGAVRKAEGMYIPDSWVEKDLNRLIDRYTRRFAADRAFFDSVEKNPELLKLLGRDKDAWGRNLERLPEDRIIGGDENIKSILDQIHGRSWMQKHPTTQAASSLANALLVDNPATRGADTISTPFKLIGLTPVDRIPGLLKSFLGVRSGLERAYNQGFAKRNSAYLQDLWQPSSFLADSINKVRNEWSRWTGSTRIENFNRAIAQTGGEFIARTHKRLALEGNLESIKFMEELGKDWKNLNDVELGTRVGQKTQGRYDYTELPRWVVDSGLAPFVRLSKYSIGQYNQFNTNVLQPLKRGNVEPLILTMFGGAVGGALIGEYREQLTRSASSVPEIKEIFEAQESGNLHKAQLLSYRLMHYLQLSATMGELSSLGKLAFDMANKNRPQGYNYPLVELGANAAIETMQATMAAFGDSDSSLLDIGQEYLTRLARGNTGMGRIVMNNWEELTGDEKKTDIDLTRQYRRYRLAQDYPVKSQGDIGGGNPYEDLNLKEMKTSSKTTYDDFQRNFQRALKAPNQVILDHNLNRLTSGSTRFAPSLENNEAEFWNYYNFLVKTKGPDVAQEMMSEYLNDQGRRSKLREWMNAAEGKQR